MTARSPTEQDLRFQMLAERLRLRQEVLSPEIAEATGAVPGDPDDLRRLHVEIGAALDEALSLFTYLLERDAADEQLAAAETLVAFFQTSRERLARGVSAGPPDGSPRGRGEAWAPPSA